MSSFEIFRRHQKKLIAVFGILAMAAFVLSDSLPRMLGPSYAGRDQVVVTLYGREIRQSDINAMQNRRGNANLFVSQLGPYLGPNFFGEMKTRDIVDALVLEHEADRLGMPDGPEVGKNWLKRATQGRMSRDLFESILARFNNRVSGEQVLADIASQVRLANVRRLPGAPTVTPYDIFQAYRAQNERVSAKLVEVPVDTFLAQVAEPSSADVQAYYDKFKDVAPDPARATPGFKVPRRIQAEVLSIDGNALARDIKAKLSEAELKTAYENHKSEYQVPSELPIDLFAGQPELTPAISRPFEDVRAVLASALAEERAEAQIVDKFANLKDEVLIPFADDYQTVLADNEEAVKQGSKPRPLPAPKDLSESARKDGSLHYEKTPMLTRAEAERYGQLATAELGLARLSGGRKFAEEFFDSKSSLYEPEEFTDLLGTRYLVRKIQDEAPHVPPLDEIRAEVVLAWKLNQARPLAKKAAEQLAEKLGKNPAALKDNTFEGHRVVSLPPLARQIGGALLPGSFEMGEPTDAPVPDVDHPGEAFRDTYFSLKKGDVQVAPNQPETVYYVMSLEHLEPATFTDLYSPNGDAFRYSMIARQQAERELMERWMGQLRKQAGIAADWVPPDEARDAAKGRQS